VARAVVRCEAPARVSWGLQACLGGAYLGEMRTPAVRPDRVPSQNATRPGSSELSATLLVAFSMFGLGPIACEKTASSSTTAPDETKKSEAEPAKDVAWVDVDLAPGGIGATIHGPDGARVEAKDDYVEVEAGDDFHMQVHRGEPNMLEEKADIVRRHGPDFRRFVRDDTNTVIWETGLASDSRFHFFSTGKVGGLSYYCNTVTFGVKSLDSIERMMKGCHEITAHAEMPEQADVKPANASPAAAKPAKSG
jgi:hypothetical protein